MIRSAIVLTAIVLVLLSASGAYAVDEYRAFWVTGWSSGFRSQSEVDALLGVAGDATSLGEIRKANCNAVFVQVRRRADACYPSAMGEQYFNNLTPADFNALQAIIRAAHDTTGGKQRIEVHCWIVTFATQSGTYISNTYYQHNKPVDPDNYWVTLDDSGNETPDKAFDPGHPKCEEYLVNVCMDLVKNYDIDGIHYDYIRFGANNEGYNPTSVSRYNARYGLSGKPLSTDERFKQWRRDQITALVRKVYAKIQAVKPWVKQSGSFVTWDDPPASSTRSAFWNTRPYYDVYSDWDSWMQEGIVDMAVPMTYYDNAVSPANYISWMNFMKDRKANRFVIVGPGIYLNYLQDAINQIKQTRDPSPAGNYADGFSGYSYQAPYAVVKGSKPTYGSWSTFRDQLTSQVTGTPANIPQMPWKVVPTKGHISGTVTYSSNGAWADGATVSITGPEARTMSCDGTGFYAFIDLTPGTYTVKYTSLGFNETRTTTVAAGQMNVVDVAINTSDATPPAISGVQATNIACMVADITWNTDDAGTGQVEYGTTSSYGLTTPVDTNLVTKHTISLENLTPNTVYHFRVKSTNYNNLATYSGDYTFTTPPPPQTIVIDELDPQWSATNATAWKTGTYSGGYNGGYKLAYSVSGTATSTCTWRPNLPRSGKYDVYIYYLEGSNRATQCKYTINHSSGSMIINVDQTKNGRQWFKIASGLSFNIGTSGSVSLTNAPGDGSGKVVMADAVKFDYLGDPTAPVMQSVTDEQFTASTTSLQGSWLASDPESGIQRYEYAVGTAPGGTQIKGWTSAGTATSQTITGLPLTRGETYYISARAANSSGLLSVAMSSSGVKVVRGASSVAEAKTLADGEMIALPELPVSAKYNGSFFVQDTNRTSGIRVESGTNISANQLVRVYGFLDTASNYERMLIDCKVIPGIIGTPVKPLGMISKSIGGQILNTGIPGFTGGVGLNNVGLLIRIAGKVKAVVSDGYYLDDGSGLKDETGNAGIKVWNGVAYSAVPNAWVTVTGIASYRIGSDRMMYPQVLESGMFSY